MNDQLSAEKIRLAHAAIPFSPIDLFTGWLSDTNLSRHDAEEVRAAACYIVNNALAIADALEQCKRLEKALEKIMNNPHGCDFLGVAEIARAALTQPEGDKR